MNSFMLKYLYSLSHSSSPLSGISPVAVSPVDARFAELQHYMQRETDALVLAKDVVKQLEGISSLDQKALAEVGLSNDFYFKVVWIQGELILLCEVWQQNCG